MGDVHPGVESGPGRISERRRIIVRQGIRVNGQPVAEQGNAVTEIKATDAFAGIISRSFISGAGNAEITSKQPVERERPACSTQNNGAAESEFEIARGLETHFFAVEERVRGRNLVPLKRTEEYVPAHRAEESE